MEQNHDTIPRLCLNMIVKNESKIIRRCLESVIGIVDYICISDTGSTDDTVGEIHAFCREQMGKNMLRGYAVFQHEWKNFGHNRTLSTRSAQEWLIRRILPDAVFTYSQETDDETGGFVMGKQKFVSQSCKDYLPLLKDTAFLFLDADMKLWMHPEHDETAFRLLPKEEQEKIHSGCIQDEAMMLRWKHSAVSNRMGLVYQLGNNIIYPNIRLIRGDVWIECIGPTHEYYTGHDVETEEDIREKTLFRSCSIEDIGDGGAKDDKFVRDIRLLKEALRESPDNARYWFYLGNSLKNAGNLDEAISAYRKRIALKQWQEEVFMSHVYMGECYESLRDYANALFVYIQGYQEMPSRAETLYRACVLCRKLGLHHVSKMIADCGKNIPLPDYPVLFLEPNVYKYLFDEEISIFSYYIGEKDNGREACMRLLNDPTVGESHKNLARSNLRFYTA